MPSKTEPSAKLSAQDGHPLAITSHTRKLRKPSPRPMKAILSIAFAFVGFSQPLTASDITWLLSYDGASLPSQPWKPVGKPLSLNENGVLTLTDDSEEQVGAWEAEWSGELSGKEIVVEARVRLVKMVGHRGSPVATWPQRDGAPVGIEVSDGEHTEGILLTPPAYRHKGAAPGYVRTLADRFAQADTEKEFHTYQIVIRGRDMSVSQDGQTIIAGRDAFWRPAKDSRRYLRFGSTSKLFTGEAQWQFVKLGLRSVSSSPQASPSLKIKVSEPWPLDVPTKNSETRPYLYYLGRDLLLMSNPKGSDALLEPYGLRRSTSAGKRWVPVQGLEESQHAPQELVRLADGSIFGPSRWTTLLPDGSIQGTTTLLDSDADKFTTHHSVIHLPDEFRPSARGEVLIFERHIWQETNGEITAVAWTRLNRVPLPNGRTFPERRTHLMRSSDLGKTWHHHAQIGLGGEPAVVRLSNQEWLCIARPDAHMSNLVQHRSTDGGKTWHFERTLEEGSVMPDLVLMQSGVLACSYGRPVSSIMFSLDGGRSWRDHTVIADRVGFNYTTIQEIEPGRLLFMDDAQIPGTTSRIYSCYVDVQKP